MLFVRKDLKKIEKKDSENLFDDRKKMNKTWCQHLLSFSALYCFRYA
jgi:hypothetical protein